MILFVWRLLFNTQNKTK